MYWCGSWLGDGGLLTVVCLLLAVCWVHMSGIHWMSFCLRGTCVFVDCKHTYSAIVHCFSTVVGLSPLYNRINGNET